MKIESEPQKGSYEAALTEEQRLAFRIMLLSDLTLAQAQAKAPPWPAGEEMGRKPSLSCLGKIRVRLRIEERIARIEESAATRRATRKLLQRLAKGADQEKMLDEAMTLIGEQMIDASLGLETPSKLTTAAWLLLRRADQRRFDARTAIFEAQAGQGKKDKENAPLPPLSEEEREARYREIFGMNPE